jgi:photosystem I P700 chlorophyll a apoprotein A2
MSSGDLLAYHAISLAIHTSILILLKGSTDGIFSGNLLSDKSSLGFSFPCDGPGRGGTCDISSWDSFYLALFWVLNAISWATFYSHWRHLCIVYNTFLGFSDSSTYLNGWFRDYLWYNSGSIINGYNALGVNDLSPYSWLFLLAHLIWPLGFKFLISWRGYWQELIDSIIIIHNRVPVLFDIWSGYNISPFAISILEARFVGVVHFAVGFILSYGSFVIAATY